MVRCQCGLRAGGQPVRPSRHIVLTPLLSCRLFGINQSNVKFLEPIMLPSANMLTL